MPEPIKGNGRYMAGIDGIRALAVLAVIGYHLNFSWAPGGLLGVGMFFVLSGYLITDLLVNEWQRYGRLDFKDFWLRRARRLLPALLVMLTVVVGWLALFNRSQLMALRGDIISAVLYVSNWWFIFHKVSYFARFGPPTPLGHLWSLAVEEQFYLVWPLLLWLGLRYIPRKKILCGLTVAVAAASALAMALLYHPGLDPTRVYDGTDTRAFGLLIGAALAFIWPSRKLSSSIPQRSRMAMDLVGGLSLLVLLLMIGQTNQYETFLYRGGLVLLSLLTAVLVAVVAHPASLLGKAFGWGPLRWLGKCSYGIYLWHYPVIVLTSPAVNTGGVSILRDLLQITGSILLAGLSWRFIEEPIRRGGFSKFYLFGSDRRRAPRIWLFISSLVVVVAGVLCFNFSGIFPDGGTTQSAQVTKAASVRPAPVDQSVAYAAANPQPALDSESNASAGGSDAAAATAAAGQEVTAIGDSVMVDASPYLQQLLPGIAVDAQIGRQLIDTEPLVDQLKAEGKLGNRVILELGTNGPFTQDQLISLLDALGPVQQIFLVNTRVPRPWQDVVNQTLAQVAEQYPKVTLIDWYAASKGKDTYFYPDGVHLTPAGSLFYAGMVAKAVESAKTLNITTRVAQNN